MLSNLKWLLQLLHINKCQTVQLWWGSKSQLWL